MSAPAHCGISFAHLDALVTNLPVPANPSTLMDANYLCQTLLERELDNFEGSYADYLHRNPQTRALTKPAADYFVSYVWCVGLHKTFGALRNKFKDFKEDVYIWFDVFNVDQREGAKRTLEFNTIENELQVGLGQIKRAMIVMVPAMDPLAAKRCWCVFEWYMFFKNDTEVDYCATPEDERQFTWLSLDGRFTPPDMDEILSGVNVSSATAREPQDQAAILGLVQAAGVANVNNVVTECIRNNLEQLLKRALHVARGFDEKCNAALSICHLFHSQGKYHQALRTLDALPSLDNERPTVVFDVRMAKAAVFVFLHQYDNAWKEAEILVQYKLVYWNEARLLELVARILCGLDRFSEARQASEKALKILHEQGDESDTDFKIELFVVLGSYQLCLEELSLAEKSFKQALKLENKMINGRDTVRVARISQHLGTTLSRQGKYAPALKALEQAQKIYTLAFGANHYQVGQIHVHFAEVHCNRSKPKQALVSLRLAEPIIYETHRLEPHKDLEHLWGMFALTYEQLGHNEQAIEAKSKSLQVKKRLDQANRRV